MTIKTYRPLNRAPEEYQEYDESVSRRTIEQNFQDVGSDIHSVKVQADRDSSLSLRKYQFLLLGASNGCNRSGGALTFRVAVRPSGATVANEHYIYYGKSVAANDTVFIIVGITLSDNDVITVYASSGDMSFSIFGVETS